jgi:hypothetical protein
MEPRRRAAAIGAAALSVALAGAPATAEIRVGKATVSGDIDKRMIQRVVRRNAPALERCYRTAARRAPGLGSVTAMVMMVVTPDGKVQPPKVKGLPATPAGAAVARCIAGVVERFRFPAARGGGITNIRYPFQFVRDGREPSAAPGCPSAVLCPLLPGASGCCSGNGGAPAAATSVASDAALTALRAALGKGAPAELPPVPAVPPSPPQPASAPRRKLEIQLTRLAFPPDAATLGATERAELDRIAARLAAWSVPVPLTLRGRAAPGESPEIALERASAARNYLVDQGVPYWTLHPVTDRRPGRTVEIGGTAWTRAPSVGPRLRRGQLRTGDVAPWGTR